MRSGANITVATLVLIILRFHLFMTSHTCMTSRAPDTGVGRACAASPRLVQQLGLRRVRYVTCGHVASSARDFAIIALILTTRA